MRRRAGLRPLSPEFYVLYNGSEPIPNESELKLSDAFIIEQENPLCELKVKVINISGNEMLKLPIIQKCDILKEYSEFIAAVFREKALRYGGYEYVFW